MIQEHWYIVWLKFLYCKKPIVRSYRDIFLRNTSDFACIHPLIHRSHHSSLLNSICSGAVEKHAGGLLWSHVRLTSRESLVSWMSNKILMLPWPEIVNCIKTFCVPPKQRLFFLGFLIWYWWFSSIICYCYMDLFVFEIFCETL